MKMLTPAASVLLLSFGCCQRVQKASQMETNKSIKAIVNVLQPIGSRTLETTNRIQVARIQYWLQEVSSTQLPLEQMGAVMPWCTVTFYENARGGMNPISTNSIFAIRDRTTRHKLLTDEQRQKLLDIFDLKEAPIEVR